MSDQIKAKVLESGEFKFERPGHTRFDFNTALRMDSVPVEDIPATAAELFRFPSGNV